MNINAPQKEHNFSIEIGLFVALFISLNTLMLSFLILCKCKFRLSRMPMTNAIFLKLEITIATTNLHHNRCNYRKSICVQIRRNRILICSYSNQDCPSKIFLDFIITEKKFAFCSIISNISTNTFKSLLIEKFERENCIKSYN